MNYWRRYQHFSILLLLGFSSGLPLALTGSTLQAWLSSHQVDISTIGLFTLVGQPYIYKFLWAPLLDNYSLPCLGLRRSWMLVTQLVLLVTIAILAWINPQAHLGWIAILALLIAFASATQDISLDAYRIELLPSSDQAALGTAWYTGGYRIGMLVSGGLSLVLAGTLGWSTTFIMLASCMIPGICCSLWSKEPSHAHTLPHTHAYSHAHSHARTRIKTTLNLAMFTAPWRNLAQRGKLLPLLAMMLLYKWGEALGTALTMPFLLNYLGFSLTLVGAVYKTIAIIASLAGAFISAVMMKRLGLFKALFVFGILQALALLNYLLLALYGKQLNLMVLAVATETFCAGMAANAFVVLLMRMCQAPYTAAQYAILSAVVASGRVFTGPIAGYMVKCLGWSNFFISAFLVCLPGLFLLYYLASTIKSIE